MVEAKNSPLMSMAWFGVALYSIGVIVHTAYRIRMAAIDEHGSVIHEFDPYFNYRATEYLYANGAKKFFTWFDYMSWYPLGRPVGTTIYPGMQFIAVWIKTYLVSSAWTLTDVCCYIPAWFGAIATMITGLIAYECSLPRNTNSNLIQFGIDVLQGEITNPSYETKPMVFGIFSPGLECAIFAMAMMAIVPAHLMRSVGGGYDNESVAITAMVLTFYFWIRSLRNDDPQSYLFGILTGLSYFYMVAAWGGYIFVLNMVGLHAAMLVGMGRFSDKAWASYSLFYVIGTLLAMQIPVVGWAPLKSLEQLGPCGVFLGYQVLQACEYIKRKQNLSRGATMMLRFKMFGGLFALCCLFAFAVAPTGYFGPISARVRGLFVQHTRTGNPLVDSVAEHQPASSRAYFQYLHHVCSLAPIGLLLVMGHLSDSSSFLLAWGITAYFFSNKMVRLILLTAPIGSILGGIAAGRIFAWCIHQWWETDKTETSEEASAPSTSKPKPGRKGRGKKPPASSRSSPSSFDGFTSIKQALESAYKSKEGVSIRRGLTILAAAIGFIVGTSFNAYCWRLSKDLSGTSIILVGRLRDGSMVKVDDYREAYWWLRDNTEPDARVMAWWDYGYQIAGIANRTTIADGNTWNHEHIALLGMALTTNYEDGYEIARHLADYVLIWGGGGGDDLAKSPHLARIANSVYRYHCPGDPTCRAFGFIDNRGTPSPMMERSMLYRLHGHNIKDGVSVDSDMFTEVHRSRYGKVRIYKVMNIDEDSKAWVANPENKVCDAPGSWFCRGQYPPGLKPMLDRKKDFQQLEDFNRGKADEDYHKQYVEDMKNPQKAARKAYEESKKLDKDPKRKNVDEIYNKWEDTEDTTLMWRLISTNQVEELKQVLDVDPTLAFVRSKDGRGPMWWAFEQRNEDITKILMKAGVPHTDLDTNGLAPVDLLKGG